ncbi:MAG: hypothetical protein ACMV1B_09395 [Prevotella sp.]
MISKELLSAVLGLHCGIKSIKNSKVIYWFDCIGEIREHSINIYELAHKCKEWAFKYRYMIDSNISPTFKEVNNGMVGTSLIYNLNNMESKRFQSDTEPEAIFKACEWILTKDSK